MTPQDLDRLLANEPSIEPSPRFTARVMRAVRADVAEHRARTIAWQRLWPGLALLSVVVPAVVALRALAGPDIAAGRSDITIWLTLTIAGTLALASWSARLITRN